jgi:hypothetical protein
MELAPPSVSANVRTTQGAIMKIRLKMLNGPTVEHYVSQDTFKLMESHVGCGAVKTYNLVPVGRASIDWSNVVSVAKIGVQQPAVRRSPFVMPKFGFR